MPRPWCKYHPITAMFGLVRVWDMMELVTDSFCLKSNWLSTVEKESWDTTGIQMPFRFAALYGFFWKRMFTGFLDGKKYVWNRLSSLCSAVTSILPP